MQQQIQRNDLILPDVYTLREYSSSQTQILRNGPLPGEREIKVSSATETVSSPQSSRNAVNQFMPTLRRDKKTMRAEIVLSAEKLLLERLDI